MYGPLAAYAGSLALDAAMARETMRKKPFAQSLGGSGDAHTPDAIALMGQLDKRALASSGVEPQVGVEYTDPTKHPRPQMAQNSRLENAITGEAMPNHYRVHINPNADKAFFAHELGHIASDRTKVGNIIRTLSANPKLKNALIAAGVLGGTGVAYAQEGTEDMDEALAISLLAASPTLADEALATQQGLGMMADAGMKATPGQRARLAGGYLTYLGAPLVAALGANTLGNVAGQDY